MPRIAQEFVDFPYDELQLDQVWTSTYEIAAELVDAYDRQVGAHRQSSRRTAPPWVFCTFLPMYRALGGRMEQGSVHVQQTAEHHAVTYVGEVLDVEVRVSDKRERDGRKRVALETSYRGAERDLRCRVHTTLLWGYSG
ncbi:MAG: hypothetical protein GEV07_28785 [Streptosporangiales bacterium]|nr:hypothetical protein [Streptosporangiales bacterium]